MGIDMFKRSFQVEDSLKPLDRFVWLRIVLCRAVSYMFIFACTALFSVFGFVLYFLSFCIFLSYV